VLAWWCAATHRRSKKATSLLLHRICLQLTSLTLERQVALPHAASMPPCPRGWALVTGPESTRSEERAA
jgi:hypothetical protein